MTAAVASHDDGGIIIIQYLATITILAQVLVLVDSLIRSWTCMKHTSYDHDVIMLCKSQANYAHMNDKLGNEKPENKYTDDQN